MPVPEVKYPVADAFLYDSGVDGYLHPAAQGFYYPDFLYLSFGVYAAQGFVSMDPDNTNRALTTFIPEVQKVICTPIPVALEELGIDNWIQNGGNWQQVDGLEEAPRYINKDSNLNTSSSLTSDFVVPVNGSWSLSVRRYTPKEEQEKCYTYVVWDNYALIVPYNDTMALFKFIDGEWFRVSDVYLPGNAGQLNDEGSDPIIISYMNIAGKILISGDWFRSNFIYEENEDIIVGAHRVTVGHVGTSWQMAFYPTQFKQGFWDSTPIPFSYPIVEGLIYDYFGYAPKETKVTVVETDNINNMACRYRATLKPSSIVGVGFNVTPEVDAITIKHPPVVVNAAVPFRNLAHPAWGERVIEINGEEGIDFDTTCWSATFDNQDSLLSAIGSPLFMKPYKIMTLFGGYVYNTGVRFSVPLFTGVIVNPVFSSSGSRKNLVNAKIANLSWVAQQIKNKGDWPAFDGWTISEALLWLAAKCKIHAARCFFVGGGVGPYAWGVNQTLSRGLPNQPLWYASVLDTSAWDMMKKIADYIKYDLYFNRVGQLICKPKQLIWDGLWHHDFYADENTPDAALNYRNATDIELSYMGEEWFNSVYVGGYARTGGVISAHRINWASIYDPFNPMYIGFEKPVAAAYETFVDFWKVQEIADVVYAQSLIFSRKISFTTYFNPIIQPGEVFRLMGTAHDVMGTDAFPRFYRIISLSHNINLKQLSTTNVVGEFIGPIGAP